MGREGGVIRIVFEEGAEEVDVEKLEEHAAKNVSNSRAMTRVHSLHDEHRRQTAFFRLKLPWQFSSPRF